MGEIELDTQRLQKIWGQKAIPVIVRSKLAGVRLKMRLPYAADNREWLIQSGSVAPQWIRSEQHWYLPKSWFDSLVDRALARYGRIYIIQPYRSTEVCAPACWNALGHVCECSCQGKNHGTGDGTGFFVVSETFAVALGAEFLACRLLVAKADGRSASQIKPAGPTAERLKQSAGFFELGGDARSGYRFQMADSPLGRLMVRQKISGVEYMALVKYASHWLGCGLAGHVASADPDRLSVANAPGGLFGSEKVAWHREQYQEAVKAIGRRLAFVVDQVACHELRPEQVGGMLGYLSPTRGREKVVELLREAAASLIDHWNRPRR